MILRRLYLYLVSAAALGTLATGLSLLGMTVLLFVFNDPLADSMRPAAAIWSAMTLVAFPVWGVHYWFARRYALRDPAERASAIRRLYIYWACLVLSIGAAIALAVTLARVLNPVLDGGRFDRLSASQGAWTAAVLLTLWAFHFRVASRDRAAVGEQGAPATLRRWYFYPALLFGLFMMLSGASYLIQMASLKALHGSAPNYLVLSDAAGELLGGLALWGFHARMLAVRFIEDDRKSTLRALEGFIAVGVSIAAALIGASQILYYVVARVVGISNPGGVGNDILAGLAAPGSQLIVFGVAWFMLRRRLARDAGAAEASRQAAIRRLYTNLAALVSLAAFGIGAGGVLWTLAEQAEAPIIGVQAADWKDPMSLWVTLLVVGAAVWLAHWRHAPATPERQSLSRRLYVWAALLVSVLAVLGGGIGLLNAVLQQVFSARPRLDNPDNLNFGHALAVVLVAAVIGIYHWRVLRADAASRPAKAEAMMEAPVATVPEATVPEGPVVSRLEAVALVPPEPSVSGSARRFVLSVEGATDDDIHTALAGLPPQASYRLVPSDTTE
ncbi:MAG TPA: DUF5671 domain-containing protein [Candidatus Dormibacteraeota bacterium]|nr:DUF5671 domain-containing protein [Candidatus Dormibacteraeota bacterium]